MARKRVDFYGLVGDWPFGEPGKTTPAHLLEVMDRFGIDECYVTDIGAILKRNPVPQNRLLCRGSRKYGKRFRPVAVVDLSAGTVEQDIRICAEWGCKGVRIAPNYHGYSLTQEMADALVGALGRFRLPLFVSKHLEDPRHQHPCLGAVANLTVESLQPLLMRPKGLTIVLNHFEPQDFLAAEAMGKAKGKGLSGKVFFDVSGCDLWLGSLEDYVAGHGSGRLVFGSGEPFLYAGAVQMNLERSGLSKTEVQRILHRRID